MDTSKMQVPLKGAVKFFEAGLQSQTWDIHGMPHFVATMHCKGYNMCEAYTLHILEVSRAPMVEIPSREVEKAFHTTWLNIIPQIEDEASSESNKKVEWYSNCHNSLIDDVRLAEEKAPTEWDHCWKADEKSAQANSKITELEVKLTGLQRELTVGQKQDKRTPIDQGDSFNISDSESQAIYVWKIHPDVKIDSLGVIACSLDPNIMCKEAAWLVKRSKPAYMEVLRVFNGKTLFYS